METVETQYFASPRFVAVYVVETQYFASPLLPVSNERRDAKCCVSTIHRLVTPKRVELLTF